MVKGENAIRESTKSGEVRRVFERVGEGQYWKGILSEEGRIEYRKRFEKGIKIKKKKQG